MRLGSRLVLPLLPAVAVIMGAYAAWAVRQRERVLVPEERGDLEAFAGALGVALEHAMPAAGPQELLRIVDEASHARGVYGILVYDAAGGPLAVSATLPASAAAAPAAVLDVLVGEASVSHEREVEGQRFLSVLRPLRSPAAEPLGVLEVTQSLSLVEAEKLRTRRRFVANTLTLLGVLTALTLLLVHHQAVRPLASLASAVERVGRGDLAIRLPERGAEEIRVVAAGLNRMGRQLERARAQLLREAEERVELERRVREAEKLAATGTLAAGVAHQIAAPLHVIGGRAELLLERAGDDALAERHLRVIVRQISRISAVVRNLLEFARRPEARPRQVDVEEVLDDVLALIDGELAAEGIVLHRVRGTGLGVRADPDLLQDVFLNLLINAVEALREREGARTIEVTTRREGAEVVIDLRDSGPGIAPEMAERVFEPFFTTKPGGTGLGLAVVRSVVREMGGEVELASHGASDPGGTRGGAAFQIRLPVGEGAAEGPPPGAGVASARSDPDG